MFNHTEIINDIVLEENVINSYKYIRLQNAGVLFNLAETVIESKRYVYAATESDDGEPSDDIRIVLIKGNIANQVTDVDLLINVLFPVFKKMIND